MVQHKVGVNMGGQTWTCLSGGPLGRGTAVGKPRQVPGQRCRRRLQDQLRSRFQRGENYRWHGSRVESQVKLENTLFSLTRPR